MEYIINPAWFYWINVADTLKSVFVVLFVVSCAVMLATLICGFCDDDDDARRRLKYVLPAFVICLLAMAFSPSKDTLIEMQVAKIATVDNAKLTVDALKSAVDYIINAINSLK